MNNLASAWEWLSGQDLELGDDALKKIAVKITEKLRNLVRRTLRKWKYPPDQREDAVDLVLKQAEVLCAGWAV